MKDCHNCLENTVEGGMDNGYYRNYEGCKTDAYLFPICKECVDAGTVKDEGGNPRLYLGPSRSYEVKQEAQERHNRVMAYGWIKE